MKKSFKFLLATLALMLLVVFVAFSQEVETPPIIGPDSPLVDLLSWVDALYGAIVIIGGYLSQKIPLINKIPKTAYRVAAIALVVGGMFLLMGKASAFGLLFAFLSATNFYELILKFFNKTKNLTVERFQPE